MAQASPDNIDMGDVFQVIRRRLPRLLIASIVVGALTFFGLSLVAPRYQSEAQLVVSAKGVSNPFTTPQKDGGAGSDMVSVRMDKEAINTHVRALLSPELGTVVASENGLAERAEFNSALGPTDMFGRVTRMIGLGAPRRGEAEQDRVLDKFYERLEVYSPRESRAIAIRFTSTDPDLSASVANGLAEAYRRTLATQSIEETDEVQKALEPKIERLKAEVSEAEAAVERFRGEANIFKGGQQSTGLNEQQLTELTAELSRAQAAKSEADSRMRSARELIKAGSGDALPEVQKSPLIQNVVQQRVRLERQISELSATLLPGHPRMRQLNADLAGLKKQITAEVAKVVDSLDKEAKAAALRVEAVTRDLNDVKARVVDTGPDEVKLRQLENEARSKRSELERLQAQFEANRAKADSRVVPVEAQIVSRARAASVPVFPRKGPFAGLAAFATFLFGLALTVTTALLSGARGQRAVAPVHPPAAGRARAAPALQHSSEHREEPLLGRPGGIDMPAELDTAAAPTSTSQGSARVGSIGALARRISSRAESGGYRVMVAGESETLSVSGHASELVKVLAENGLSVILVDWSPEGGGVAEATGLKSQSGLTELLSGEATFENVIRRLPGSEAHLMVTGRAEVDDPVAIDPDRLNLVLDALDEAYDTIVICGRLESARTFFEIIEGRVDCAVTIADPSMQVSVLKDLAGTYLGFEVADIDLVRFDRSQPASTGNQRIIRSGRGGESQSRSA